MPGKMRLIKTDGKSYEFTPGDDGGIVVRGQPRKPMPNLGAVEPVAKAIGPGPGADQMMGLKEAFKPKEKVVKAIPNFKNKELLSKAAKAVKRRKGIAPMTTAVRG